MTTDNPTLTTPDESGKRAALKQSPSRRFSRAGGGGESPFMTTTTTTAQPRAAHSRDTGKPSTMHVNFGMHAGKIGLAIDTNSDASMTKLRTADGDICVSRGNLEPL